jgi:hypothetical protein
MGTKTILSVTAFDLLSFARLWCRETLLESCSFTGHHTATQHAANSQAEGHPLT